MLGALALGGCAAPQLLAQRAAPGPEGLRLIRRSWHSDLALPAAALPPEILALFPGATWLVFGFGDRVYIMAKGWAPGAALAALFPGPGAILMTGLAVPPETAYPAGQVTVLHPPPGGLAAAARFIAGSIASTTPLGEGPYAGSLFLPAVQRYSARYTCNTWTAEGLAAAGLPLTPADVVVVSQVNGLAESLVAAGY